VPDVGGLGQHAATTQLTGDGFKVVQTTQDVSDKTKNLHVVDQDPVPGTQAGKGAQVTITVGHYVAPVKTTPTTTTTTTATTPPPPTATTPPTPTPTPTP
jgi:PASTA domain